MAKPAAAAHRRPAPPTAGSTDPAATAHDAVYTLLRLLLGRGIGAAEIAAHTGIDAACLDDPDARVPLPRFNALWRYATTALAEPALALDLHERYPEHRMHFVAHLGMRCGTMREAIDQWRKYALLVSETDAVHYEVDGRQARFVYRCLDPRHASRWMAEHYLAVALSYARTFSGRPLQVDAVRLMHEDPGYADAYQRVFGRMPTFAAHDNALLFDAALLDVPFQTADPYLRHFLEAKADELMARLEPEARIGNRVVQALSLLLTKGQPLTLESVAQVLMLPPRRLRLMLESDGHGFRELLSGFRRDAAAQYLRQGLTVSQTAYLLGFCEPAAFQHAFRRWFGQSAGQFQVTRAGGRTALAASITPVSRSTTRRARLTP